jgi:sulfatase maturation enzyme AslB (radical SAM superfamily)
MSETQTTSEHAAPTDLSFLWLELTNRCNLQCSHCYASSGPWEGAGDTMQRSEYERILREAAALDCRQVQFIGGEPTLNPDLSHLIRKAADYGYGFIEVFANLTRVTDDLIESFLTNSVNIATSVYASEAEVHDSVTTVSGSFDRTVRNIRRLIASGIRVRAGFIEMPQNVGLFGATESFLRELGVGSVGWDRLRSFGRAGSHECGPAMSELCGSCASGTLCVAPDGRVSPCIMSKAWGVGSCRRSSLAELVSTPRLAEVRHDIRDATMRPIRNGASGVHAQCDPGKTCFPCGPDKQCYPCAPNTTCPPNQCRPYCMPR